MAEAEFAGRVALVATMHGKQAAFAPPLEALGLTVRPVDGFDTDRFGSFTGETPRMGDMLDAARAKARAALAHAGETDALVIASEGAFGPHPALPLLPGGRELALVLDPASGLELHEMRVSFETNYATDTVPPGDSPDRFLDRVGFPAHGVIVRSSDGEVLGKGVQDSAALTHLLEQAWRSGPARVETDMRAHMNPTRMAEIARLAAALAERLATRCPACASPGFGRTGVEPGLPCRGCDGPTDLVRAERWACPACDHAQQRPRSDGRTQADPGECPRCNP